MSETPKPIIRGLDKFGGGKIEEATPSLFPEGYKVDPLIVEKIASINTDKALVPFEDPKGVLGPGVVLSSPRDPDHRRVITNMYKTPRGSVLVRIHIEGQEGLNSLGLDDVWQKIREGRLVVPAEATE